MTYWKVKINMESMNNNNNIITKEIKLRSQNIDQN